MDVNEISSENQRESESNGRGIRIKMLVNVWDGESMTRTAGSQGWIETSSLD